jgi:hypothetical protein
MLLNSSQCSIPVFDGLLPEPHNGRILRLLFTAAHWHGLAKLRLHNDLTLGVLDAVTKTLGDKLREFNDKTCSAFNTRELEREYNARVRREAKVSTAGKRPRKDVNPRNPPSEAVAPEGSTQQQSSSVPGHRNTPGLPSQAAVIAEESERQSSITSTARAPQKPSARRFKPLNLQTYKLHSLGDYANTIRRYGSTDSYSTEAVSCICFPLWSADCLCAG